MKPHALSVVLTGNIDPVGAAVARALVRRGARVLLVARQTAPLVALARELAPPHDDRYQVDALAADIGTAHGRRAVLDAAVARDANALVNTTSAVPGAAPRTLPDLHATESTTGTLAAATQITRTLLPHLLSQPDARVLNIGPAVANAAPAEAPALRARHDALRGASQSLRRELAGGSVRVQFLGRHWSGRAVDPASSSTSVAMARGEQPEYIASVAVQMLLAGTRERVLGGRSDVLGRVNAALAALLHPAPNQRRV